MAVFCLIVSDFVSKQIGEFVLEEFFKYVCFYIFIIWIANVDKVQRKGVYNEKYKKTKLYFSYRNVCFNVNINIFSCSGTDNKPKQAKVTVQYASIPAKVETSSSGDIFITVKNISDDYRVDYDMRVLNNKGNVVEVSEQNGGINLFFII